MELDRIREEKDRKIEELRVSELTTKTDREIFLESQSEKRIKYFIEFKQKFGIPLVATMGQVFNEIENSSNVFEDYVAEQDGEVENKAVEYFDGDIDDDAY